MDNDDTKLGKFVYCSQHLAVHHTGWCKVHNRDKTPIHAETLEEAIGKVQLMGLKLYGNEI